MVWLIARLVLEYAVVNVRVCDLLKDNLTNEDTRTENQRSGSQVIKFQLQVSLPAYL